MRTIFLLILLCALTLKIFSQSKSYSIKINNEPLINVLKEVEKKYNLFFSYKVKDVKKVIVDLNSEASSINNLLQQLLTNTNLQFEIVEENFVVIKQKQASKTNTICGTVYDLKSKTPLPYANVLIQNTSTGTTTNEDGSFELKYEKTGDEQLSISYVGYDTKIIEASKLKNKNCPSIMLQMPKIKEAFLVITDYLTDGISVENNGAATNIKPQLTGNMAGLIEPDVLSTVQFLPGVAAPSSKASDIYIRGCTPDQNLIIWEDIPIYHTAHYFGMISAINPFIIENINVYRGGFNATYGGRIGGVVDLTSPNENTYKDNFGVGANMTHTQAYANQKFKLADKPSSITFSLRRSYNEIFETPTFKAYSYVSQQGLVFGENDLELIPDNKVDIINDFYFLDAQAKLSTQINTKNKLQIAGTFARNKFNDNIEDVKRLQTDSLLLSNIGLSAKWQHKWNNKLTTVVKAVTADYGLSYQINVVDNNRRKKILDGKKNNTVSDKQLIIHNRYEAKKGQNFQLGYHLTNYNVNYSIKQFNRKKDSIEERDSNANLHAIYLHFENPIENKIGIKAGIRASYYSDTKIKIEPRVRIDYKLSKSLSVHSSYGLYHQVLGQVGVFKGDKFGFETSLWELFDNGKGSLTVQKSEMYQAGLIFKAKDWVIDLQAYKRIVNGISSRAYSIETIPDNHPENGSSNIVGIDILIKKRIGKLRSWLSYSLSKADLTFKIDEQETTFPSNYDQRHILDWSNQLRLNNWHLSAGFKISSGLPYTEMTGFEYKPEMPGNEFPNYNPFYGPVNENKLPVTSTLNISANYQLKPLNQKWKANFTASVVNLLNTKNIYERSYIISDIATGIDKIEPIDKITIPFTPNLSVRFEW